MKENGRTSDSEAMSRFVALEQLIKQRESEILNNPTAEDDLSDEDVVLDEYGNETGTDNTKSKTNAGVSTRKTTDDDFVTDSSDENGTVVSEESESGELDNSSIDKASELKLKGDEHVGACKWAEAIKYYTEALKHSQLATLYGNRSLCYMKNEDFDKAEKDCSCAIELDPFYLRMFRRRAAIRLRRRDYYGCAKDMQDLIMLSWNAPPDPKLQDEYKAILSLARYIAAHGNCSTDQKFKKLETATLKKLCDVEEVAARVFMNRNMHAQAVESLTMAIMVSPKTPCLYYYRAMANFKLGKDSVAENDCTGAIELDPSYPQYFRLRAEVRKKLGNLSGSEDDMKISRSLPAAPAPLWDEKKTVKRSEKNEKREKVEAGPKSPAASGDSHVVVRVPVHDVYSSSTDELYDLSKLPEKIKSLFGLS